MDFSTTEVIKSWVVPGMGEGRRVELKHNIMTGVRVLLIDGVPVEDSLGVSTLFVGCMGHQLPFKLEGTGGVQLLGWVSITRTGALFGKFVYECMVDGQRMVEFCEGIETSQGGLFDFKISISETGWDENGTSAISWYRLDVTRKKDLVRTSIHRRFADFLELDHEMRSVFRQHMIFENLPHIPPKEFKVFVNHQSVEFIEKRRKDLEHYLRSLGNLARVCKSPAFLKFIGLYDVYRESSIIFEETTLGISMQATECGHVSVSFESDGAVNAGLFGPGGVKLLCDNDLVSQVNGLPAKGLTVQEIGQRVSSLPRPLVMHFIGHAS